MSKLTGYWKRHLRPTVLDALRQFGGVPVPATATTARECAATVAACRLIELPAAETEAVPARLIVGALDEIEKVRMLIPDPLVRAEYDRRLAGGSQRRGDEFVAVLDRGRVCHDAAMVITPDNRVLVDTAQITPHSDLPTNPLRLRYLPAPRRRQGCLGVVSCVMSYNYYHWLLEALPRLALYEQAGIAVDRFYAPTRFAFQRAFLQLAGIGPERIEPATTNRHLVAERLAASSLRLDAARWKTDFLFTRFTATLEADPPALRVFISRRRRGKRTLTNDDAVFAALAPLGFHRYDLETMTVAEQIHLFFHAACVVGPHGAGLTNLVFCRPGTKVVEINTPYRTATCFSDIAHYRGLDYRLHIATPVHDGFFHFDPRKGLGDSNITVDPAGFAATISDFLDIPPPDSAADQQTA